MLSLIYNVPNANAQGIGVYAQDRSFLSDSLVTMPEWLQERGVTTGGWTTNPMISERRNFHQGFEVWRDISYGGARLAIVAPLHPQPQARTVAAELAEAGRRGLGRGPSLPSRRSGGRLARVRRRRPPERNVLPKGGSLPR